MSELSLSEALEELVGAEDFLDYFEIPYDQSVVHVNRLHIMQRFHDYLGKGENSISDELSEDTLRKIYKTLLTQAYSDFVESDALTEKVFKVFHMHEPQSTFVPLESLFAE